MIGYGLAFVIGFLVPMITDLIRKQDTDPLHLRNVVWGGIFMALNHIATF